MCCKNTLGCTLVMAAIVAAIICVVGLAIPFWNTNKSTGVSTTIVIKSVTYEGLWQKCTLLEFEDDQYDCQNLDKDDSDSHAKRAALVMCLIGIILIIVFAVMMVLHLTLLDEVELLTKLAAGAIFLAALCILIAIIVYGAKVHDDLGGDLSAGLWLCLISCIMCIVIGILSLFTD